MRLLLPSLLSDLQSWLAVSASTLHFVLALPHPLCLVSSFPSVPISLSSTGLDLLPCWPRWIPGQAALSSSPGRAISVEPWLDPAFLGPFVLILPYLAHSPSEDLLSRVVQGSIEDLVSHGCARVLAAGPVCGSFSRAVTPPCRSLEFPAGVPWCSELQQLKCQQGNAFGIWCAKLCQLCDKHDVIYIIENPATSWRG